MRRRIGKVAVAGLVALGWVSEARAENRYGEPAFPEGAEGVAGTVRYEAIRQAAFTNAQIFGAIGGYERYLKPELNSLAAGKAESLIFLSEEAYYTTHVGKALGRCTGTVNVGRCENNYALFDFDMYSGVVSMGGGGKHVGFFASTSYSLTVAGGQGAPAAAGLLPITALSFWLFRIFGEKAFSSVMPGSMDAVAGLYTNVGPVSASGGYILSKGAFGSVDVPKLRAFLTAALTEEFNAVGFLKAGLRDIQEGASFARTTGLTSVFARNLRLSPPSLEAAGKDLRSAASEQAFSLFTLNAEQKDIASLLDVAAAYAFAPSAFVQEGRLSLHTPDYNARPRKSQQDILYSAGVSAGYVALPNLWYYGVEGGSKFSWSVELRMTYLQGSFRMFVRQNDPEFLTAFPFAYGAINGGFSFGFNGGKTK
jgi:hypothetical protein